MADERAKQIREKFQNQVVGLITERLKAGEMSQDRSKKIAAMVLEKLPEEISYQELMQVIPKLDDEFVELAAVVVPIMTEYEKKLHATIEDKVLELVRARKFKEAMIAARKGIELEKQLT
ncbi:hypothetical protein JW978_01460 [Candidatus Dojkabacteria bacterium]|nr:hypothetical protein [Candidatus Dojkabacteria bacterium]